MHFFQGITMSAALVTSALAQVSICLPEVLTTADADILRRTRL